MNMSHPPHRITERARARPPTPHRRKRSHNDDAPADPLAAEAAERRAYTDFLFLALYPGGTAAADDSAA